MTITLTDFASDHMQGLFSLCTLGTILVVVFWLDYVMGDERS